MPDHEEGYALASKADESGALIVLAGKDADGLYHAAQSLRQLVAKDSIASLTIADYPAMPVRGTIEGFYGKPWTMAQREAHIAFLARFKANTYIYSPRTTLTPAITGAIPTPPKRSMRFRRWSMLPTASM
nr:beta-N-acetylglucosaminidase domain-containing protein [Novosphingobium sp. 9]